jgi:hypothetical protein
MESIFRTATGFSTAAYRKQFGSSNRSLRQEEILRDALQIYSKGAIIVCNGGFPLDNNSQALLREFKAFVHCTVLYALTILLELLVMTLLRYILLYL